jgi:flagellar assembly factor FliW
LEEIVVDVESCIKGFQYVEKENIRREVGETLKAHISKPIGGFEEQKEIALLKEKNCYFLKADKGNSFVVLDKSDYWMKVLKKNWNKHHCRG